ncbi:DUF802 domain-containing protein [Luteimonas sp. MJ174]|uniref:DUF802 domain-containing protein n=1 Tax=Luteimonas sp. MJ174 TaxID=3129237 RepID=UPI0031BA275A
MKKTLLCSLVFALGLLVVCWIGAGYIGSHALALAVTALIGALYLIGGVELYRYRQATGGLVAALDAPPGPDGLASWMAGLDPTLRGAVRQRIDSGQAPLPAPSLTPYLVGLLVLLGMLGTLLGMLVTLRGTGIALQSASDLQAVRDSLAAPVEGLGVAFGTSIAGVAASAMLGLLAALCRRERADAVRLLDAASVDGLRVHTRAHQRDESLRLMQAQAESMPALVERLESMAAAMERQAEAAHERQASQQDAFHAGSTAAWERLAGTLSAALERGAADSARAAAEAVRPAVAATMDTLTREAAQLNATVAASVERQLAALDAGFERSSTAATTLWQQALAEQAGSQQVLAEALRTGLDAAGERLVERTGGMVEEVASRLEATTAQLGTAWDAALTRQQAQHDALVERHGQALDAAGVAFAVQSATLLEQLEGTHARLQSALSEQDGERLAAWQDQLATMAASLREGWARAGEEAAQRHEAVASALAGAAADIGAQSQAHAAATIAKISTLVEAASEAPRAAAEMVAELRQKLSDSMVRDTAMLAERTQLMETLSTLLEAVNHASTEQRGAIDALVSTTSTLLEQAGGRFGEQVEAGTGAIDAAVARLDAGASGVAGLGEALAGAVQQFGERNAELTGRLDGIAVALEASGTRSDEQLAYYVAQARELVDLSVLAQKQIIAELRQLPGAVAGAGAAA